MSHPPSDPSQEKTAAGISQAAAAARAVAPSLLAPGMVLANRYEIVRELGQGGMGAVYQARDLELDRMVALKIIRQELVSDAGILQRFKQELVLARQITHRNVIRIYDLGEAEGLKFITMEYVEGEDLRTQLRRMGKFSPAAAVEIIQQVLLGLEAAHHEGVIHRDLKPGNIMRDERGRIVVMDFGLARTAEGVGVTQTGALVGTFEYMSPEQARGGDFDTRSDLFAVGVILFELLTGQSPYKADTALASLLKRTQERAVPATSLDPTIPAPLSAIVARCLERDPKARYQSAADVLRDLDAWTGAGPHTSFRPSRVMIAGSAVVWPYVLAGVAAVLLVAATVWYLLRPHASSAAQHAPVSVLIADFANKTNDSVFDGTLEPAMTLALEGAPFLTTYNRGQALKTATHLEPGLTGLTDDAARLIATREGINAVVTGSVAPDGSGYKLDTEVLDGATGKVITQREVHADNKEGVLKAVGKLAAGVRTALGDTTPESAQLAAGETYSAGSLEAAHEYAVAQGLHFAGKWTDALQHYQKAVQLDASMGRAYVGIANCYYNTGRAQEAEKYYDQALAHLDRMSEREKYRTLGAYYLLVRDTDKAIEQQLQLVKLYPADSAGWANLALAYFFRRDMQKALEDGRKAVEIYPQNVAQRNNVGLYAMYAGDFDTAIKEQAVVLQQNPSFVLGYVGTALAQLGQSHPGEAAQTFAKAAALGPQGASAAAAGLADVDLYQGHIADAIKVLQQGASADGANKNTDGEAIKLATLSQAEVDQNKAAALRDADAAVHLSRETSVAFWAARTYLQSGQTVKALALAQQEEKRIEADPQAYGKLIEGEVLLQQHDPQQAIRKFQESRALADTWMGHFDAAVAYIQAEAYAQAQSELEVCLKRRGEATALFLDESPTFHLFPPVYYYLGRAQEGLKSPAASDSYKTFLTIKQNGDEKNLVADAKRRVQAQ